jgi:dGTPase
MAGRKKQSWRTARSLAPWAQRDEDTRGRAHAEAEHAFRRPYERDRDRIIHSTAFRRLEYKTQVFVNHEGDNYRTRLTHTFEVAQISRTLAREAGGNETLAEAAALAHDLGHPPFGHTGEAVMNEMLAGVGGFEHNLQGLRIVDRLETAYPDFPGLNLTYEMREAFAKHHTVYDDPAEVTAAGFDASTRPPLEIQLVNLADEIAYSTADIDDGLRSGLLDEAGLEGLALWRLAAARAEANGGVKDDRVRRRQCVRFLIDILVTDILATTSARIEAEGIDSAAAVRAYPGATAASSAEMEKGLQALGRHLMAKFYNHPHVREKTEQGEKVLRGLFKHYMANPGALPDDYRRRAETEGAGGGGMARAAGDYMAGMTDRYAIQQWTAISGQGPGDGGQ